MIKKSETLSTVIVVLAQTADSPSCAKATSVTRAMPGGAAAATAEETPVPKEGSKNEKGQKSMYGRGGGNKPPTGSGDRDVSPSTESTSSWIKIKSGRRTIQEWMKIDQADPTLDWNRALEVDKRSDLYLGAPCYGDHNTTNPLARHANQYKVSYKCVNCKLVMLYIPRHGATGEYRKAGPLGKTVSKIDIQEITKERRPKSAPKKEHSQQPPVPEWSESEDSFEKEGTSDEETPWIDTGKKRATTPGNSQSAAGSHAPGVPATVNDLMRDSTKRPAATPSRRRTPKTSPQGGGPEDV